MKTLKIDCDIGYETGDTWFGRQIGPDAVSAFLADCQPGERVKIEINSAGGYVIPGMAICNSIKNSQAHVVAHVVGLAASMASVIMCACDEIQLEEGSFVMIHNPWGWAEGDADELRKEAEVLDTMKAGIMAFYRAKFPGKREEEISAMMDEETWMTGDAALAAGLKCIVIPSTVKAAASATRHHFASIPEAARRFLDVREKPTEQANTQSPAKADSAKAESQDNTTSSAPPASEAGSVPAAEAADWESRLAGLQAAKDRELAEMSAKYKADVADMKRRHEEALAAIRAEKDAVSSQLDESAKALATAQAEASSLKQKLGDAESALAQTREQLDEEIKQHRKLASAAMQQPVGEAATSLDKWTAAMREIRLARRGKKQ